jgi:hypothetical protein
MRIGHVPDEPPTVSGAGRHPRADPLLIEPKAAPAAAEVRIEWIDTTSPTGRQWRQKLSQNDQQSARSDGN